MMRYLILLCSALSLIFSTSDAQVWQSLNGGLKYSPVAMTETEQGITVAYKVVDKGASGVYFGISSWNGTNWAHFPMFKADSGANINAIKWYKNELYIAGEFNSINSENDVRSLIKFSNRTYTNVKNISTSSIKYFENIVHLSIYNGLLVVAGQFSSTEIKNSANIAFFDGGKWVEHEIKELEVVNGGVLTTLGVDDHFYIGGIFTRVGTTQTKYLAHFEKGELKPFTNNRAKPVRLVEYNGDVVGAGPLFNADTKMYFFKIDGDTVIKMSDGLDYGISISDVVVSGDVIYASGLFKLSSGATFINLIQYQNGKWTALNPQLDNVNHLLVFKGVLFGSGSFKTSRDIDLNFIAKLSDPMYGVVKGLVYHDKDTNCLFNGRDERLNENIITINPGKRVIRPRIDGTYQIFLEEGKYTISVTPQKYWRRSPCASLIRAVEVSKGAVVENVDFPLLQQSNIKDLTINLTSTSGPRAVANNVQQYFISYENLGSSELIKGTIKLALDPRLDNMTALPKPSKITSDTVYWEVEDLSPGEKGGIKCLFKVKDTAKDLLELTATIAQQAAEDDNDNNTSSLTQKIMSEDVEIRKYVNPGSTWQDTAFIQPGTPSIQYQISFANYTNDTVRSVYVIDTVSLDETIWEIKDIAWSHPVVPITIEGPKYADYVILIYKFEDINLPPNPTKNGEIVNDEGHITFELRLNNNLQVGMEYINRAKVVFDYDFNQMTNEVLALVEDEVSVFKMPLHAPLTIYPNPTEGIITVDVDRTESNVVYKLISITGSNILSGTLSYENTIDLTSVLPGIYFINLATETGQYSAKIIKQ